MTRVLILGATGMLGHKLCEILSSRYDVIGTLRSDFKDLNKYDFFRKVKILQHIDVIDISRISNIIEESKPQAVINCVGVIKPLVETVGIVDTILINSVFPHQLSKTCQEKGTRCIHISTDCVFSGLKGHYGENDPSDANDVYGKTKYLGEIYGPGSLTIRTSIIGRELVGTKGLLEWFISNKGGRVQGYTNAIFSGFPTLYLAQIIAEIIEKHQDLNGIYHISSEPISKYDLLTLINDAFGLKIEIEPYQNLRVDRSLDSARYREKTGFNPLPWGKMIERLAEDSTKYFKWRQYDFPE